MIGERRLFGNGKCRVNMRHNQSELQVSGLCRLWTPVAYALSMWQTAQ